MAQFQAVARHLVESNAGKTEQKQAQDLKVIQRVFDRLDKKKDGKVDKDELESVLLHLGYEPVKVNQYGISEVEHMIWEVDEDCDGCVSWEEFKRMFELCRNDKTGREPKKLFNVCQFMTIDLNGDGEVSTEECMEMIMHRYGRAKLDQIFPSDEGNREITLTDFLQQIHATTMNSLMKRSAKPHPRVSAASSTPKVSRRR
eukprot:CAMPEP_0114560592 /NCGR_PEP_ID=MMETSP0114-20121206/11540_1 /TAXON_ID=31324 /ORGANISM="Goniomonas sp, Strain m" /LENGTH=200 /DNA_ID=CAMNT_0001746145 /DNA_START=23 /DNA_END=625 /DNA_ORIENTATION=+